LFKSTAYTKERKLQEEDGKPSQWAPWRV